MERAKNADLLIIHTIFRPQKSDEPLKQDDPLSLRRISGEGHISEHKTYLGWYIQTCSLRVFLPLEKDTAWVHDISESLALTKINIDKL